MKNKLKKLITLFALSVAFISAMSCKLSINKTEETENKTETKLVKITPVLQEISRIAYPDFSSFDVTELGDYYIRAAEKSDEDFGDWLLKEKFATYDDFMSAELYLPEGEFTFLVIAHYERELDGDDIEYDIDVVEFDSIFDYTVVAGQENIINIVLKPVTEDRFNSKTATLEYTFNIDASIINPEVTSAYCVYGRTYNTEAEIYDLLTYYFDEDDYTVTSTDEGTTITFTKTLDINYGPYVVFNFEDESHNIYQYGTTAVVIDGMKSTEVVNVKKFYKGYPITYHLENGETHVEYYATTYGYQLWDAENHIWFEDEAATTLATSKASGKAQGAVDLWENSAYIITLVDVDTGDTLGSYPTKGKMYLSNTYLTSSIETTYYDFYVRYCYKDANKQNTYSMKSNNVSISEDTTVYVETLPLHKVTVVDQNGTVLCDDYNIGYRMQIYTSGGNTIFLASLDSTKTISLGADKTVTGMFFDPEDPESKIVDSSSIYYYFGREIPDDDLTIYINYVETHTISLDAEKYGDFTYNRIYKLPINGTNCKVVYTGFGHVIGDDLWISSFSSGKTYADKYVPSVKIEVIDTTEEWSYDVGALVIVSSDETPRTSFKRVPASNSSDYEITDVQSYCAAYTYTLNENGKYSLWQINSSTNNSYLEGCTSTYTYIVNDTTGSIVFESSSNGSFTVPATGTYTVYVRESATPKTGVIKAGHVLFERTNPTVQLISIENRDVAVTSDVNEDGNVILTASAGYETYEWSWPPLTGEVTGEVIGTEQTLTLILSEFSDIAGEPLEVVIKATYPNGTWRRTTYLVDIINDSGNGGADYE